MKVKLPFILLVSLGLVMFGCESDDDDGDGNGDGEVSGIYASVDLIPLAGQAELTVDGSDYELAASAGTISGETFTAPSTAGVVTITATAGSESVTCQVVVADVPEITSQWAFNGGDGLDGVGIEDLTFGTDVSASDDGLLGGGALFAGTDGDETYAGAAFGPDPTSLSMEADQPYTVSMWVNTADTNSFFAGMTYAGAYLPNPGDENPDNGSAKGLYCQGNDTADSTVFIFDNSWVNGVGGTFGPVWDSEWHHVAWVHAVEDYYTIYIDGVGMTESTEAFGTTPDAGAVFTVGAALEDPAYGPWPHVFQGTMDEIVYWDEALTEAQIQGLYNAHP